MKKLSILLLAGALSLCAQGKGKGGGMAPMGAGGGMGLGHANSHATDAGINPHSNRPGVADRDFGRDRAEDVGKGKKKGFGKVRHSNKKLKHQS